MLMDRKKITVKHYLNKRAKPREYKKELFYPLYIQIIVDAKKAQIKSRINEHLEIYQSEIDQMTKKNKERDRLILSGCFTEKQMENVYKNVYIHYFHISLRYFSKYILIFLKCGSMIVIKMIDYLKLLKKRGTI